MPRTRTRIDDEEALIPRSDLEEFHIRTKKKVKGRCSGCCSVKCWFGMLLLLILMSTAVFYFIYPSIVHESLNKIIGLTCSASGYSTLPNATVTCLVMTSPDTIATKGSAVKNTWGDQCTKTYYFYEGPEGQPISKIKNTHIVDNVTSMQPISIALKGNATSWYLHATDDMYVSHRKLQRQLATRYSLEPLYVGDKVTSGGMTGAFVLSYNAAVLLVNRTKSVKTENLMSSIVTSLNLTNADDGLKLNAENPLQIEGDMKMKSLSNAFAFQHVSPEQMYSFYVFNSD